MTNTKRNFPGPNDGYVEKRGQSGDWVKTQIVQTRDGYSARAVLLVECSVNNPSRLVHLNGVWFKLEEAG